MNKQENEIIDLILRNLIVTHRKKLDIKVIQSKYEWFKLKDYNRILDKCEFGYGLIQRKDYDNPNVVHFNAKLTLFGFEVNEKYNGWINYLEKEKREEKDRNEIKKINKYSIYISTGVAVLTVVILLVQTFTNQKVIVEYNEQQQKYQKEYLEKLQKLIEQHQYHFLEAQKLECDTKNKNVDSIK